MFYADPNNRYQAFLMALLLLVSGFLLTGALQLLVQSNFNLSEDNLLYVSMGLQQVFGFVLPAFIFMRWRKPLRSKIITFDTGKLWLVIPVLVGLFVFTYLLSGYLMLWNYEVVDQWQIEAFKQMETQANEINYSILGAEQHLILKLSLMAILPGICEELFFRGILLPSVGNFSNLHVANLVTALIFSILHFQPYKIVPMFVLALVLGYIYIYTQNILFPIIFHFLNNAVGVIVYQYRDIEPEQIYPEVNQMPTLFFIVVVIGLIIFLANQKPRKEISI